MKPQCATAASAAAGRQLSAAELRGLEDRIANVMRHPPTDMRAQWAGLSQADRAREAAKVAAGQLIAEQLKKAQRQVLTIEAAAKNDSRLADLRQAKRLEGRSFGAAVAERLNEIDVYGRGVARRAFAEIMDVIDSVDTKWAGLMEKRENVEAFIREVFDPGSSGDARAAKAAKVYLEKIEAMRQRFNAAGGDVGQLDYGYVPQRHDVRKVLLATKDAWVDKMMGMVDRARYFAEDGTAMPDAALRDLLGNAWETIKSDGRNKITPGKVQGKGMLANRRGDHRVLHFKDADAYLAYMAEFGEGGIFAAIQSHVGGMARDIALLEQMGPNPEAEFKRLNDMALVADGAHTFNGAALVTNDHLWKELTGYTAQRSHAKFAMVGQGVRSWMVASKLGSAILSSFTDTATLATSANLHRMPLVATFGSTLRQLGPDAKAHAARMGLVSDTIVSNMNRWADGVMGHDVPGKLASLTMRASMLTAWTDALRQGFGVQMMATYAERIGTGWKDLHAADRYVLDKHGITAADWALFQQVTPENWNGTKMLTPEAVEKSLAAKLGDAEARKLADKLLGHIIDETEYGALNPDLATRAALKRGTQAGSVEGEFLRALNLFKSFPVAMITRHMTRAVEISKEVGGGSAFAYGASLIVGLTAMGALSLQAKDIVNGKDARDMTDAKFWAAAFLQGGGAGIFGDLMYTGMGGDNRGGAPNWVNLAGPVIGTGLDAANATLGNAGKWIRGEDTKFGADMIRIGRQNLPVVGLWYTKGVLDHMIFHDMLEWASPGYLSRMRQTARRDWGQDYWWEPGENVPARAPALDTALGN